MQQTSVQGIVAAQLCYKPVRDCATNHCQCLSRCPVAPPRNTLSRSGLTDVPTQAADHRLNILRQKLVPTFWMIAAMPVAWALGLARSVVWLQVTREGPAQMPSEAQAQFMVISSIAETLALVGRFHARIMGC